MKKLYRMTGIAKSRFMVTASKMPGLSHWPDRETEFDVQKSEVVKWLMAQPDIWDWMVKKAYDMGVIVFDAETKLWHGVDTEDGRRIVEKKSGIGPNEVKT